MWTSLSGPLSQKRLEISDIGGNQHAAFGDCQFKYLRVGEPFELYLGVEGSHGVSAFDEGFAHGAAGDVGV